MATNTIARDFWVMARASARKALAEREIEGMYDFSARVDRHGFSLLVLCHNPEDKDKPIQREAKGLVDFDRVEEVGYLDGIAAELVERL